MNILRVGKKQISKSPIFFYWKSLFVAGLDFYLGKEWLLLKTNFVCFVSQMSFISEAVNISMIASGLGWCNLLYYVMLEVYLYFRSSEST